MIDDLLKIKKALRWESFNVLKADFEAAATALDKLIKTASSPKPELSDNTVRSAIELALCYVTQDHVREKLNKALDVVYSSPKPVSGWQPIETAPKDGNWIILTDGKDVRTAYWAVSHYFWCLTADDNSYGTETFDNPTHWMPIPSFPKQEISNE